MAYALKSRKPDHEFSSTQVDLPDNVAEKVRALGRRIPKDDLADDGREDEPHVTVKFGLHDDKPTADLKRAIAAFGPIQAKLGRLSLFQNDDADVVKAEVISHDLHRLNKKIAGCVKCTDTHPEYKPHVTVAYVKRGKGAKYTNDTSLRGEPLTFDHVLFSSKDRSKTKIPTSKGYSLK